MATALALALRGWTHRYCDWLSSSGYALLRGVRCFPNGECCFVDVRLVEGELTWGCVRFPPKAAVSAFDPKLTSLGDAILTLGHGGGHTTALVHAFVSRSDFPHQSAYEHCDA